jgi:hypothetical protein
MPRIRADKRSFRIAISAVPNVPRWRSGSGWKLKAARYGRRPKLPNEDADSSAGLTGHRHGHRSRSLTGTFGCVEIAVPRARINGEDGKTLEWKSKVLRAYQRRTLAADALIASTYLSGTKHAPRSPGAHHALGRRQRQRIVYGVRVPRARTRRPQWQSHDQRIGRLLGVLC